MHDSTDRGKRYRSSLSRARALYRLPTALASNCTLELYHRHSPLLDTQLGIATRTTLCNVGVQLASYVPGDIGTSQSLRHADYRAPLPFEQGSFDRVLLHRTLDDLAMTAGTLKSSFDAPGFLAQIARVLVPGGLITGCIDNRVGLKSLLRRAKRGWGRSSERAPAGHFTPRGLHKALVAANFTDIQLFILLPNCDDPLRLVDIDPQISKVVFRHELLAARQLWSRPGYLLRLLAVELGVYSKFEESIFFWAHKRC